MDRTAASALALASVVVLAVSLAVLGLNNLNHIRIQT